MRIQIVCPAPAGTLYGNRISALRWARILRELGHRVAIETNYTQSPCDVLVALHARRSANSVFAFKKANPDKPAIVALTGTDLYHDLARSKTAQRAVDLATRLIALQPLASEELDPSLRDKLRVIYQSVDKTPGSVRRSQKTFQVAVVGHLRTVKDPFRTAIAARDLPGSSTIRVVHAGAALTDQMSHRAKSEEQRNPRYRWLGEIPRPKVRRLIASSHVLVLSSRMEGGANVISEAIVDGTPVLASRIPGSIGLLGADYPGMYPYGDTSALRSLLLRSETDRYFYGDLQSRCSGLARLFDPSRERLAWRDLLQHLHPCSSGAVPP